MAKLGRKPKPALERFWSMVDKGNVCWNWTGALTRGYGRFNLKGGSSANTSAMNAHRAAYLLFVGPIPEGMVIDHLCRNRRCVNPDHLEAVTNGENVLRGNGQAPQNAARTHCIHGHEFTRTNTYVDKRGRRHCIACRNRRSAEYRQKQVAA